RNWLTAGSSPMALTLSGMALATGVSEQAGECTTQRHEVVRIPASFGCAVYRLLGGRTRDTRRFYRIGS
ncbi:MAG TPA: hypothetical protein VK137_02095, partial [Planctomycetaceae bacterium]|nr:hypothetical protein [Planctomycetaceae bacterium]